MELSKSRKIATFLIISVITGAVYYTPYLKNTFYDQMMTVLISLSREVKGTANGTYNLYVPQAGYAI